MRLVTGRTIDRYAAAHADAREALAQWCAIVRAAAWRSGNDAVQSSAFPARAIAGGRLIFNIKGNDYRIVCDVQYADPARQLNGIVRVQFIGTHAEYDRINAENVTFRSA